MFSTGQLIFAILFIIVFSFVIALTYKKDKIISEIADLVWVNEGYEINPDEIVNTLNAITTYLEGKLRKIKSR